LDRISASEGIIWEDIGWLLQKLPRRFKSVQFFAAAQDQDGGDLLLSSPGFGRAIQYSESLNLNANAQGYWTIRFRGW
jgi:hypothetical protein